MSPEKDEPAYRPGRDRQGAGLDTLSFYSQADRATLASGPGALNVRPGVEDRDAVSRRTRSRLFERERQLARRAKTADVLSQAADLLERTNWIQRSLCQWAFLMRLKGTTAPTRVGYCIIGAIWEALGWPLIDEKTQRKQLAPIVKRLGFKRAEDLAKWNDKPKRQKKTVIALLRRGAAKQLEMRK